MTMSAHHQYVNKGEDRLFPTGKMENSYRAQVS